jgi:hypothetical protein
MDVIAEGIPRDCHGDIVTVMSLGYPRSVFNKNSAFKQTSFSGWEAMQGFSGFMTTKRKKKEKNTGRFVVQPIPFEVTFSTSSFKAQSSKLERDFLLKCGKRDVRALSFEL